MEKKASELNETAENKLTTFQCECPSYSVPAAEPIIRGNHDKTFPSVTPVRQQHPPTQQTVKMSCVCRALVVVTAFHLANCPLQTVDRKIPDLVIYCIPWCNPPIAGCQDIFFPPDHYLLLQWWMHSGTKKIIRWESSTPVSFKSVQINQSLQISANIESASSEKWEFEKWIPVSVSLFFSHLCFFALSTITFTPSILLRCSTLASWNHLIPKELDPDQPSSSGLQNESQKLGLFARKYNQRDFYCTAVLFFSQQQKHTKNDRKTRLFVGERTVSGPAVEINCVTVWG